MEIPIELKRRADVIKTEKKKRRFRVIRNLAAIVLILFLSGSGAVYLNFNAGLVTFFLLLLVGSMVVFIVYFVGTVLTKLQDPLSPMEKSFELLYSTLDKDWGSTTDQTHEATEDERYIRDRVRENLEDVNDQLDIDWAGDDLLDEVNDLIDRTQKNIRSRLIPAIESGALTPETLAELAKAMAHPTFESLNNANDAIEKAHQSVIVEEPESGIKKRWSELRKRGFAEAVMSIAIGYGAAWLLLAVFGFAAQEDLATVTRNQIGPLIVAGGALSALFSRVFMKRDVQNP